MAVDRVNKERRIDGGNESTSPQREEKRAVTRTSRQIQNGDRFLLLRECWISIY
jgi:hypothetical protein